MIREDTPNEHLEALKQAYASGRLLVFCGAGVSRYAGFPGFGELIRKIVSDVTSTINADYAERGLELYQKDLEKALDSEKPQYPLVIQYLITILDRLELDGRGIVLSQIILGFKERYEACRKDPELLTTHKKILELATTDSATRLVTTNWDDLFHLADSKEPKRQRLSGLVGAQPPTRWDAEHVIYHCHGYIDEAAEASTTSIILTERDYETIYFNPNSDAQHVLEGLFDGYVTLFIGYSVETVVKDLTRIYRQNVEHVCRSKGLSDSHKQAMLSKFYVVVPYHESLSFLVADFEQWQEYERQDAYPIKCISFQVPDAIVTGQSPDINVGLQKFIDHLNLAFKPNAMPFKSSEDLPATPSRGTL